jgi:hypothetical protein
MGDIGPGHVAANQNSVGVVRTNGWMEHCPATSWANDLEITWAGVTSATQQQHSNRNSKKKKDHLFLFFTFVPIVSLSFWQKLLALSIPLKNR